MTLYISLHQKSYIPSTPSTAVNISPFIAAAGYSVQLLCCQKVCVCVGAGRGGGIPSQFYCKSCFRVFLPASTYSCISTPHKLPLSALSPLIWSLLQPMALDSGFAHTEIPLYGPIRIRKEGSFTLALNPFNDEQKGLPHTGELKEGKGGIFWSNVYSI